MKVIDTCYIILNNLKKYIAIFDKEIKKLLKIRKL